MSGQVLSFPQNPGAVPVEQNLFSGSYGDTMNAPGYLADTAPQSNYLGDGIAGPGPSMVPAAGMGIGNGNAKPDGGRIRIVPNPGEYGAPGMPAGPAPMPVTPESLRSLPSVPRVNRGPGAGRKRDAAAHWGRFGAVDGTVVALSVLAGFAMDKWVSKKLGVPAGYAGLMGGVLGTAAANGIAAYPEGATAALSVATGTLVAVAPAAVAMKMGKPLTGKTAALVGISTLALLGVAYFRPIKRLLS
jgi:hypothetical protein